jgi:GT2 family glycosyltransferase
VKWGRHREDARLRAELERLRIDYANLLDVLTAERAHADAYIAFLTGDPYPRWIARHTVRPAELERRRRIALGLQYRPTFSLLMHTAETAHEQLRAAIAAVAAQAYDAWQLCATVPANDGAARTAVDEYAAADPRIVPVVVEGTGPAAALAAALARATGEFVGVVDADGLIPAHALAEFALELNLHVDADVLYCDSDSIDQNDYRHDAHFKPEWSPDTLLSRDYIGRLALMRRSIVEAAGGFRSDFEGSHEWDLLLRVAERTNRAVRVPDVLYHVRSPHLPHAAIDLAMLTAAISRRGEPGTVAATAHPGTYAIRYELRAPAHATLIIPTRDAAADVDTCLRSIFTRSTYRDFDVLLVDNGSTDPEALALFKRWSRDEPRVRVIRDDSPFNFSRLNNAAAKVTGADFLIFLNNDTEVIAPDWMECLLEQAQRPSIGAVGALLLYPDDTVQHAGVVIGLGGAADHSHKHFRSGDPGYFGALAGTTNYSAVTAACLAIRRELFEAIGGFDEQLAVAYNDVDLCLRLLASGKRNVFVPGARLYHFESKSRGADVDGSRAKRFREEMQLLQKRWRIGIVDDPYYNPNLTLAKENFAIDA